MKHFITLLLLMAATFCQAEVTVYGIRFCARTFEDVNEDMTKKLGEPVQFADSWKKYLIQLDGLSNSSLYVRRTESHGTSIWISCQVPVEMLESKFQRIKDKCDTQYGTPLVSTNQSQSLYKYTKEDCMIELVRPLQVSEASEYKYAIVNIFYTYQGKYIGIDEL